MFWRFGVWSLEFFCILKREAIRAFVAIKITATNARINMPIHHSSLITHHYLRSFFLEFYPNLLHISGIRANHDVKFSGFHAETHVATEKAEILL